MAILQGGDEYRPSDARIVNVFVDDENKVIPSRAATVGEMLRENEVKLGKDDVVEPTLDTPIVEDNFRVNVYRARPVTIIDKDSKLVVVSAQKSPRMVASQANVETFPEDIIQFEPGSIRDNILTEKVVITRSTPVFFNLYGTPITTRTHAKTVSALLSEKQVSLKEGDTVQPSPETPVTPNVQVFVVRNGVQIASVTEDIPMPVQTVEDASLSFGTTVVRQSGAVGKRAVTYEIKTQNSVEISRVKIQEATIQAPVTQIVARGKTISIPDDKSSIMAAAGIAAGDYGYVNYIISRESGWCATKWQGQIGYCPTHFTQLHSNTAGVGFGLCQSTPAGKMASAGADWQTNPVTQLKWCHGYAIGRYKSWSAAYNYWIANRHW